MLKILFLVVVVLTGLRGRKLLNDQVVNSECARNLPPLSVSVGGRSSILSQIQRRYRCHHNC